MLNLDREIDQSIMIGQDIEVVVIDIYRKNGKYIVRLGIDAPQDVDIFRNEVYNAIQRKKRHENRKIQNLD